MYPCLRQHQPPIGRSCAVPHEHEVHGGLTVGGILEIATLLQDVSVKRAVVRILVVATFVLGCWARLQLRVRGSVVGAVGGNSAGHLDDGGRRARRLLHPDGPGVGLGCHLSVSQRAVDRLRVLTSGGGGGGGGKTDV